MCKRWLFFVGLAIGLLALGACSPPPQKTTDAPVGSRKVIEPDRLYFKNIKASRYASMDDHQLHRTTYIHKKLNGIPDGWEFLFVDDWLNDRAWLEILEPEAALFYRLGAEGEEIILFESERIGEIEYVKAFGNRLSASYEICRRAVASNRSDCLLAESSYRLALRETITDYLRLTNAD